MDRLGPQQLPRALQRTRKSKSRWLLHLDACRHPTLRTPRHLLLAGLRRSQPEQHTILPGWSVASDELHDKSLPGKLQLGRMGQLAGMFDRRKVWTRITNSNSYDAAGRERRYPVHWSLLRLPVDLLLKHICHLRGKLHFYGLVLLEQLLSELRKFQLSICEPISSYAAFLGRAGMRPKSDDKNEVLHCCGLRC